MAKYEVQTFTLCDGWVNTWSFIDANGQTQAETFNTKEQAAAALDEFMQDIEDEIEAGQREPDEGYSIEEFRIVKIRSPRQECKP